MKYNFDELKGFEIIDTIINNFTSKWGIDAEIGIDFAAWPREKRVSYALVVIEDEHKWFEDSISIIDPDITCDPFLSSILHEIGHIETFQSIDENDLEDCLSTIADLEYRALSDISKEELHEINKLYFEVPIEKKATEWAIQYMREHTKEVTQFWSILQPALLNFYLINEIDLKN